MKTRRRSQWNRRGGARASVPIYWPCAGSGLSERMLLRLAHTSVRTVPTSAHGRLMEIHGRTSRCAHPHPSASHIGCRTYNSCCRMYDLTGWCLTRSIPKPDLGARRSTTARASAMALQPEARCRCPHMLKTRSSARDASLPSH